MSLKQFNKVNYVFDKPEDPDYIKLDNYPVGTELEIHGFYLSKGKYGASASMWIGGNVIVNLPKHKVEDVQRIINDEDAVTLIKKGNEKCVVRSYIDDKGIERKTVEFL